MRILYAIHDFLPRHRAGSEIYAFDLCRQLSAAHDVTVVCAEYDQSRPHGHVTWRAHEGIPVVEIVNNWVCGSFEETYQSPLVAARLEQILQAVQPDIVHVHSLFNLSFDLPAMARARGVPVVATLHDYTLVCPSGGQRIHRAGRYVCHEIDTERCARCFRESVFYPLVSFGRLAAMARTPSVIQRAALRLSRRFPALVGGFAQAARRAQLLPVARQDVDDRLAAARRVFEAIDLFVAPSASLAAEFQRLGISASKIRVSDYGFPSLVAQPVRAANAGLPPSPRQRWSAEALREGGKPCATRGPLRIGFVGTLVWHKGVHVLLDAVRGLPADTYEVKIFGSPDASPEYVAELRAGAGGLPVQFMGAFDRAHMADAYAQIDVLVVPSLWLENSPLVIHEAFMAGVPVVAARIGGIAGLVDGRRTGLLYDPASAADLQAALRSLIDNPDRLRELAGTPPPVKSIAQDAREWEEIYAGLLRRRSESLLPA